MFRVASLVVLISGLVACETDTPCSRYADYVCQCEASTTANACSDARALSENPSQSVSDQCAADLADLQQSSQADTDSDAACSP